MSQVAVATFLRFFTGNTDVFKWQNFCQSGGGWLRIRAVHDRNDHFQPQHV